jgi:hypothetical protein
MKEFECESGHAFEALLPVCPVCGALGRRVFRTPPGISKGTARRDEAFLSAELARRGITNYSNRDGIPHPTFGGVQSRLLDGGVYQSGEVMAGTASPASWQASAVISYTNNQLGVQAPISFPSFERGRSEGPERVARSSGIPTARIIDQRDTKQA